MSFLNILFRLHGTRRKLGFCLLMTSMVLAIAWVRSGYEAQQAELSLTPQMAFQFQLYDGICGVSLVTLEPSPSSEFRGWNTGSRDIDVQVAGCRFLRKQQNSSEVGYGWIGLAVPFWSLAVPLLLLTTWLLWCKPRNSAPKQITDPLAEKIA